MLDKIRYRLVFNRTRHLKKDGKASVQLECLLHGKRVFFATHVCLTPSQWSNGFVVNHPHAHQLNSYLYRFMLDVEKLELEFIGRGQSPTLLQLKNAVLRNITSSASFRDFVESVIEHSASRGKHTKDSYKTLVKHVENFQDGTTIADIDLDFLNRFAEWSRKHGMSQSTISGRLKSLRAVVNEAIARKLISADDNPFKSFKIKKIRSREESLTADEIRQLERAKLRGRLAHIRDVFVFDCLCGLRYSDLTRLTEQDFVTIQGKKWIVLQTRKTGDTARIPIETIFHGRAMKILSNYKSLHRFFKIGNNASSNRTLKEVFAKAGVNKYAHFHLARHTFITLCIEEGIPITTVQMMAAHSKIETTRGYAKLGISTIKKDVERVFRK